MPLVRLAASIAAVLTMSACASLTGGGSSKSAQGSETESAEIAQKAAALEVEVARLKAENARLANQLLDLERSQDEQVAEAPVIEVRPEEDRIASAAPSELPVIPQPPVNNEIVVAETGAPELRESDVPIDDSPRLVQPTFASTEPVFENEAGDGEIETASVLHGVHLASYRKMAEAREGWRKLQRENPEELGLLEPRIETVSLPEKGEFLRLIGGGFSSEDKAFALCQSLKDKGLFCTVSGFSGERLALENGSSG